MFKLRRPSGTPGAGSPLASPAAAGAAQPAAPWGAPAATAGAGAAATGAAAAAAAPQGVAGGALSAQERWARALKDVQDQEEYEAPQGLQGCWDAVKHTGDRFVHVLVDIYTSAQYWLQSNYPRGYILVYIIISLMAVAIYAFDIVTDVLVAKTLLESNEREIILYGWVVVIFTTNHYFVVAAMLAVKFWYHWDATVLARIQAWSLPWEVQGGLRAVLGAHHGPHVLIGGRGKGAVEPTPVLGALCHPDTRVPVLLWRAEACAWLGLGEALRGAAKGGVTLAGLLAALLAVPLIDLAMMGTELWMGLLTSLPEGDLKRTAMGASNFLLQYQTVRVPSECFLESLPQTCFQGYLYMILRGRISVNQLAQSIAVSGFNVIKNLLDIYLGYKVSGFSFAAYSRNALLFEGASALPVHWNSLRSSMAERLVLWGDFHRLAHAQKMKLFQSALQRKRIVVTTHPERFAHEECVVVASSWLMAEFIASMLPVSLSDEESDARIVLHLEKMGEVQWRDDLRHTSAKAGAKLRASVWQAVDSFVNAPLIWQNLTEVILVDNDLDASHALGISELLVRSTCLRMVLSGNCLGDDGLALLAGGLQHNTSLRELRVDRNQATSVGAFHLQQGLASHAWLRQLHLGWNRLGDEGLEHVAALLQCVTSLGTLSLPGVQAGPAGVARLCEVAREHPTLERLDLSSNARGMEADGLASVCALVGHSTTLRGLALGKCALKPAGCESLISQLAVTTGLRRLDLSGTYLSRGTVGALCGALEARHADFVAQQERTLAATTRSRSLAAGQQAASSKRLQGAHSAGRSFSRFGAGGGGAGGSSSRHHAPTEDLDHDAADDHDPQGLRDASTSSDAALLSGSGHPLRHNSEVDGSGASSSQHLAGSRGGGGNRRLGAAHLASGNLASLPRRLLRRLSGLVLAASGSGELGAPPLEGGAAPSVDSEHNLLLQEGGEASHDAARPGASSSTMTAAAAGSRGVLKESTSLVARHVSSSSPSATSALAPRSPVRFSPALQQQAAPPRGASGSAAAGTLTRPGSMLGPRNPSMSASSGLAAGSGLSSMLSRLSHTQTNKVQPLGPSHPSQTPDGGGADSSTNDNPPGSSAGPVGEAADEKLPGGARGGPGGVAAAWGEEPRAGPAAWGAQEAAAAGDGRGRTSLSSRKRAAALAGGGAGGDAGSPREQAELIRAERRPPDEGLHGAGSGHKEEEEREEDESHDVGLVDRAHSRRHGLLPGTPCPPVAEEKEEAGSADRPSAKGAKGLHVAWQSGPSTSTAAATRPPLPPAPLAPPAERKLQAGAAGAGSSLRARDGRPSMDAMAGGPGGGADGADRTTGAQAPPLALAGSVEGRASSSSAQGSGAAGAWAGGGVGAGSLGRASDHHQHQDGRSSLSTAQRLRSFFAFSMMGSRAGGGGGTGSSGALGRGSGSRHAGGDPGPPPPMDMVSRVNSVARSALSGLWPGMARLHPSQAHGSGSTVLGGLSDRHQGLHLLENESLAPILDVHVEMPYLQELALRDCGVPHSDLGRLCAILAESPGLVHLDLSGNPLGNRGLEHLADVLRAQRATLLNLSLCRCQLGPASMAANGAAHALGLLVEVDLSDNPLGDSAVGRLAAAVLEAPTAPTLQVLRLRRVGMGAAGMSAVLAGLAINSSLRELDCSHNQVGMVGLQAWAHFCTANKTLRLLDLRHNALGPGWCRDMMIAAASTTTTHTILL